MGALGNKTVALAEALASLNPNPESVLGWTNSTFPSSDAAEAAVNALSSSNLKQGGIVEELRGTAQTKKKDWTVQHRIKK
jgi:hypothetical protein